MIAQINIQVLLLILLLISLVGLVVLYVVYRKHKKYIRQLEALNFALQKSKKQVLQTNEKVDGFVHTIAHDLINRLHNVILLEQIESNEKQSAQLQNFKNRVLYKINHLITYCEDLLSWSRGNMESIGKVSNLSDILAQLLSEYEAVISSNHITVISAALPKVQLPPPIAEQVLANLLDNAIKHTKDVAAKHRIEISAYPKGQQWIVQVKDNGKGIAPNKLDQIFTKTSQHRGLSLVKHYLSYYQSDIWVENNADGGVSFYFSVEGAAT
ncbi:MAG: HAMP domain-containing sensor histidine kinase [Bacteroidota bacterium]